MHWRDLVSGEMLDTHPEWDAWSNRLGHSCGAFVVLTVATPGSSVVPSLSGPASLFVESASHDLAAVNDPEERVMATHLIAIPNAALETTSHGGVVVLVGRAFFALIFPRQRSPPL